MRPHESLLVHSVGCVILVPWPLWFLFLDDLLMREYQPYCGQCYPWAGSLGWYKTTSWTSHGEKASKQHCFSFWFRVPVMSCYPNFTQWKTIKWNKPFPFQVAFAMVFIIALESNQETWIWNTCLTSTLENCSQFLSFIDIPFETWGN